MHQSYADKIFERGTDLDNFKIGAVETRSTIGSYKVNRSFMCANFKLKQGKVQ